MKRNHLLCVEYQRAVHAEHTKFLAEIISTKRRHTVKFCLHLQYKYKLF